MLLPDWLLGTETIYVPARERRIISALLLRCGISAIDTRHLEDGGLEVVLRRRDLRRLRTAVSERGLPIPAVVSRDGFPRVLAFWKKRPGLPIGAVLALTVWILSTLFVWRVDVVCLDNAQGTADRDRVDVTAIREELQTYGVAQGMFLLSLDARYLENRFLIGRDDISWMAINRYGTVLSVEVRPAHTASHEQEPKLIPEDGYLCGTHLVADADGRILSFSVRGGQPVVTAEQMVLRGELLASGIYTSETGDVVGGRAHGEVLAETVRILQVQVPLTEYTAQTNGESRVTYALDLFGKQIISVTDLRSACAEIVTFLETFFKNGEKGGIDGESYGIITNETISEVQKLSLRLPNGVPLPADIRKTTVTGVHKIPNILTEEQALLIAKSALDADEAALNAVRILSREESAAWEGDMLTVTRYVYCVDNIAAEQEYRIRSETAQLP